MSNTTTIVRSLIAWPSGPDNLYSPWPVIARRLLFCPLVYAGLAMAFAGLVLGWGWGQAVRFWRDAR